MAFELADADAAPSRRRRRDSGRARIQERDVRLMGWVADQYAIRVDHLTRLEGLTPDAGDWMLRRWRKTGWVLAERLIATDPLWLWPTEAGLALAGRSYGPWVPRVSGLPQLYAINAVRLQLEAAEPSGSWVSERAQAAAAGRFSTRNLPDALWRREDGTIVAIEVPLVEQGASRMADRIEGLLAAYDEVWCFAPDMIWAMIVRLSRLRHWYRVTTDLLPA